MGAGWQGWQWLSSGKAGSKSGHRVLEGDADDCAGLQLGIAFGSNCLLRAPAPTHCQLNAPMSLANSGTSFHSPFSRAWATVIQVGWYR